MYRMYFLTLNCTVKMVRMVNLSCIFWHSKHLSGYCQLEIMLEKLQEKGHDVWDLL